MNKSERKDKLALRTVTGGSMRMFKTIHEFKEYNIRKIKKWIKNYFHENNIKENKMSEFKKYQRTKVAEMRPVTESDIHDFDKFDYIPVLDKDNNIISNVSISDADIVNGSPYLGDMIARNPKNHKDQWLVAKDYFIENF